MKRRNIKPRLEAALADTPVLLLHGARQTGKTTLVESLARERAGTYLTLDDATVLAAAAGDAAGFLSGLEGLVVIDEVQKAPELLPAIKIQVDRDRRPGRFLLTGSTNVLMLPKVSESLAGRMEILTLRPLSQGEIEGHCDGFIDALFGESLPSLRGAPASDLSSRLLQGGFPECLLRPAGDRRRAWFASYITTILQRDVRDLANIEGLTEMPRLLSLLAARTATLVNRSELSRAADLPYTTLNRYLTLLEMTHLVEPLPAWSANLGKRLVRSPKLHLADSALAAHLTGLTPERLARDPTRLGPLLETFVTMELRKQSSWSTTPVGLFHFRTSDRKEVDVVMEDDAGRIVGLEVKASASVGGKDLTGLRVLAEATGERFHRGVLLYGGDKVVPFGSRISAIPIDALWRMG